MMRSERIALTVFCYSWNYRQVIDLLDRGFSPFGEKPDVVTVWVRASGFIPAIREENTERQEIAVCRN